MRKRLAMAALTLTVPAAVFTLAATPAEAVTSNTCGAVNFLGEYCGYYAGSATTAEFSTNTAAVKEIQDLIDRESNFPGTKLAVDGSFGSLTFSAVEWLQSHDHICGGVDGIVGSCTWAYLRG
jgi:hypothetical protein